MRTSQSLILVILSSLAVTCYGTEIKTVDRIIGGTPTTIDVYPGLVQLDYRRSGNFLQNCGANILNNWYIVTAAHCIGGAANNFRIRAGATNRQQGGTLHTISRFVIHPGYGLNGNDADIAVARLGSPLNFNRNVQPVSILSQGASVPDGEPVIHAGWGRLIPSSFAQPSPVLRHVTIYSVNHAECRRRYAPADLIVTDNMICAGVLDVGGRDSCMGDSGGPLYWQNILVGIISWGVGCGNAFYPGVNTAVSSYTDWILATAV